MPLAIGAAAFAFVFLALLSLIFTYWLLTKWHDYAQGIPLVGGALANMADYLRARNVEIGRDIVSIATTLISFAEDKIQEGFQLLNNVYNAGIISQLPALGRGLDGLQFWVDHVGHVAITQLQNQMTFESSYIHGFLTLNVDAFIFWKAQTQALLDSNILPTLAGLTATVAQIATTAIPGIQLATQALGNRLDFLTNGIVKPMNQDLQTLKSSTTIALTDPVVGAVPRIKTLEGDMAQVLPWAAAIGLSIPLAQTLGRIARDPCYCLTQGNGQDIAWYEYAQALDLD
jgi:hypothetical protein